MSSSLKELLDKLGVGYVLSAYETCPWSTYDEDKGLTCSAEVRMSNDADEMEAEIQLVYDDSPEGKAAVEQVFYMFFKPVTGAKWGAKSMLVRRESRTDLTNWEGKGLSFFSAVVQELKMGTMPDIDALLTSELHSNETYGGGRGGGGSKSPKIKPQKLMGLKGGRGF